MKRFSISPNVYATKRYHFQTSIVMPTQSFSSLDINREYMAIMLIIDKVYSFMNNTDLVPTPYVRNLDQM